MNKNIITLACSAVLTAGMSYSVPAYAQSQASINLAIEMDAQIVEGMTQDDLRGLLGAPVDVTFTGGSQSWTYPAHDGAKGYSNGEYSNIKSGRKESSNSSSSKTTVTKRGFGGFGKVLGNAMGGNAGKIVKEASKFGDSTTTTTESSRSSSTGPQRGYIRITLYFDKETRRLSNYVLSPK